MRKTGRQRVGGSFIWDMLSLRGPGWRPRSLEMVFKALRKDDHSHGKRNQVLDPGNTNFKRLEVSRVGVGITQHLAMLRPLGKVLDSHPKVLMCTRVCVPVMLVTEAGCGIAA